MATLLIAGGGTGGHLFPGVAVAEEWLARDPSHRVAFAGTERGIEARVIPELGYDLHLINVSGLKTVGVLGAVRGALRIPGAIRQSKKLIDTIKPCAVIGVGGYASGPVVLAARARKLPRAILEQNSIPGLTNRILGKRYAQRVFLSFPHSESFFRSDRRQLVGNPIRRQILDALQKPRDSSNGPLRIFVFGGSQGAVAVNAMAVQALAALKNAGIELSVVHQTGDKDLEPTRASYAALGIEADCSAFIRDMASQYRAADIIVSRAGATTIAELGVVGVPAVLIPYPYAANNHQVLNAQEMVDAGAAVVVEQTLGNDDAGAVAAIDGARLAEVLKPLCTESDKRAAMGEAMRTVGRPDAATRVVDWISEVAR